MTGRGRELAERRADLGRRIEAQRSELGAHCDRIEQGLAPVELGVRAARWIGRHPWPFLLGGAVLIVARPRLIGPLLRGGMKAVSFASGLLRFAGRV